MSRRAPLLSAAVLLAAVPLLAACGGDDDGAAGGPGEEVSVGETIDPSSGPSALPDDVAAGTDDLRAAVRAFSDALLTGDGTLAYAFYTPQCQTQVPIGTYELIVDRAGEVYGEPLPFATYEATTSEREVDGERVEVAEVDYTFRGAKGLVQTDEQWTRTPDGWRLSDC